MKKIITTTLVAGLMASVAAAEGEVPATEVSVTVDYASAYVFRGATLNDSGVLQTGLEATGFGLPEGCGSLTLGVWGNFDLGDNDGDKATSEFSEVDLYASYGLPSLIDGVDLFVGYMEYTYAKGKVAEVGAADKEFNAGLGFSVADVALGATVYLGTGGGIGGNEYFEFTAGYDLELSEELGASLGASAAYFDPDAAGESSGWSDSSVSASLSYSVCESWSIGASVTYITELEGDVLEDYDVDTVGMLSLAGSF